MVGSVVCLYAGILAHGSRWRCDLPHDCQSTLTDNRAGDVSAFSAPSVGGVACLTRSRLRYLYTYHRCNSRRRTGVCGSFCPVAGVMDTHWSDHALAVVVCCCPSQLLETPSTA